MKILITEELLITALKQTSFKRKLTELEISSFLDCLYLIGGVDAFIENAELIDVDYYSKRITGAISDFLDTHEDLTDLDDCVIAEQFIQALKLAFFEA